MLGTDYLFEQPGTLISGGPFNGIAFAGTPIGPGNTTATVQRPTDVSINGPAAPVMVTAFAANSTAPVNISGTFFDVFLALDPAHLAQDVGTISISGSLAGGTFQETLDYFADVHLVQVGAPSHTMDLVAEIMQSSTRGSWSPHPALGDVIVPGPHDGSPADQLANLHSGPGQNDNEVDFFPVGSFDFVLAGSGGGSGVAVVTAATVPEPGSVVVLGAALLGFAALKRARSDRWATPSGPPRAAGPRVTVMASCRPRREG